MLQAKKGQRAAFFFRDGQPQTEDASEDSQTQLCVSYTLAAEANFKFIREAGTILPQRPEPDAPYSEEELKTLGGIVYNMPSQGLFAKVDALPKERRAELTTAVESELRERTGSDIHLAADALPFVWRSSSIFLIRRDPETGEDRILFNVRSHRTLDAAVGKLQPGGSGYMSAPEGKRLETAVEGGLRELAEESGIRREPADVVPLGYAMHDIPMKMPLLAAAENDGRKVPGLMTEFTFVGYVRLADDVPDSDIDLNSESLGSVWYSYENLRALSTNKPVGAQFLVSQAPFATDFVGDVRKNADEATPIPLARLAEHAWETAKLPSDHHGQRGRLDLHDPVSVNVTAGDFMMGTWNGVAMAMHVLQHAGHPATQSELAYVAENTCISHADIPAGSLREQLELPTWQEWQLTP